MKRKVESAHLKGPAGFPIGGETSLYESKQPGIVMFTGIEPGFLTVHYKEKELGIPLSNVNAIVWEKDSEPHKK